jgi:hypothetical protein
VAARRYAQIESTRIRVGNAVADKSTAFRQLARLAPRLDPRLVGVSYAWWFPEKGVESLHGWQDSNLNTLTDSKPPYNPQMGSANLRGMACRVYADTPDHPFGECPKEERSK